MGFVANVARHFFGELRTAVIAISMYFAMEEQPKDLKLTTEIYIDNKPDFYQFKYSTEQLTEADVIALFSPDDAK